MFNLLHICAFTWHTAARALQSNDLSGEGIDFGSHTYFFPHKGMESLPGWGISSMPGPSPRQHEHERRYTPVTHPFMLTRWIWKDEYDGQMIFGDLVGLKLPEICLTGEESLEKNLTKENCPDRESNPGPLRERRAPPAPQRWFTVSHSYNIFP